MAASRTLRLSIHDVAFGGKGVARDEGKVFFVPFTVPGETVTARVVRQKKNFAEAELVSVDVPSPDRVPAPCPYFERCGGCSYQHITYSRQLEIKASQVEQTLRRVGKLGSVPMRPMIAAPHEYGYRNRIRVHVEGGVTGFFAHDAHTIVDVERCAIAAPVVNEALHNLRRSPVVDGDYSLRARGGGPFFEQTNPEVTRLMLARVHEIVRRGQALLVDAYCGAGLFARHLAGLFEKVIGIEENTQAIEKARRGAGVNEQYVEGDVSAHLGDIVSSHDPARTTVLLDPPATGVAPRVVDILAASAPSEILYVSCNPATLARDLSSLVKSHRLESVTPLDMFPQTAEIEVVAHLVVREAK
jgi:23S rRNA (uracil1939-C5)-methyltransferase